MIAKIFPHFTPQPDLDGQLKGVRYFDIRKLTEYECFRLMDVDPEEARMLCDSPLLSKSARYKLAGNSIVVSCLYHIFRQIWFPTPTQREPSLFADMEPEWQVPLPYTIRMVTLCSGYDSQALAMRRLCAEHQGAQFDLSAWAEFDPESKRPVAEQPAVIAHNILFPQWADRNLGDMTKIDWQTWRKEHPDEVDILTYSTPCQSISQAGKREGIAKGSGTRSAVLWYTEEAIRTLRPKFLLQENVRALCNKVNLPDFEEWQQVCTDCGYDNYWTVMNAKNYGIPQNRDRVFMLSVRKDLQLPPFTFPEPFKLTSEVADILEEDVSQAYYLNPENVIKFLQANEDEKGQGIIYRHTDRKYSDEELAEIRSNALRHEGQTE
jgi:DNA-cytosine methyltransferase